MNLGECRLLRFDLVVSKNNQLVTFFGNLAENINPAINTSKIIKC